MTRQSRMCLRGAGVALATVMTLLCASIAGHAQEFTAEQRAACTPDAFRLCASEIPKHPGHLRLHAQEPQQFENRL
jgi:hypothetical protein